MKLTSPAFQENSKIPKRYTCQGEGLCPALEIDDPPKNTASFVVIMHDPDAPGTGFTHWVVWNIEPSIREIEEMTIPVGACEGMNGVGEMGWIGPCPPTGAHRYEFRLYALDSKLDLPLSSTKEDVEKKMKGKILEETKLVGTYEKG